MIDLERSAGITRRDFVNGTLVGAGALLSGGCATLARTPSEAEGWDGFGGVGDYARSHGNSYAMQASGHLIRDGAYETAPEAADTGELFDLVVVGAGISGLSAALHFLKERASGSCLVLDNHLMFGGESKRNEFDVAGHLVAGPQGANSFPLPLPGKRGYDTYSAIGMPREFQYVEPAGAALGLQFCRDNFEFQYWKDRSPSFGWFFAGTSGADAWVRDIWSDRLDRAPFPDDVKADFIKWRSVVAPNGSTDRSEQGFHRWLDTMSYRDLIEKVMGLDPAVTRYADPILASACSGMGCDVTSAFAAYSVAMPGFRDPATLAQLLAPEQHSFPGGNDVFSRHFVKTLIPAAIRGGHNLDDIMNAPVDFAALDRAGQPVSIRLGATVIGVAHEGAPSDSRGVTVTYSKDGKILRLRARAVVMAGGSWTTRRIVRDLPLAHRQAYQEFYRTPLLVANVAVKHWRFLAELKLTACRWFEGFGYACNIRQPLIVGRDRPVLDPDKPAVISFYVPFFYPGQGTIHEQAARGRGELLATSYADYERQIREQLQRLFGAAGFRQRDVAGIILNRWGHAYLCPQPGFYFGRDGGAPPRDVIRTPHGRIAFAHSELNGQQNWIVAADEGRRALSQVLTVL